MMRILVEPSDYTLQNIGDTAMLQTAVRRLKALFPDSLIQVFTDDPTGLAYYCPESIPLSTTGRSAWLSDRNMFYPLYKYMKKGRLTDLLSRFERGFRRRWPSLTKYIYQYSVDQRSTIGTDLNHYYKAISEADLVVVSGMGGITDAFLKYAFGVLDTLDLAIHWGVPTAMLGQGIGPIQNPELMARAKEVLPHIDLIALREGRAGLPLLKSLGVPPDRVMVTGDDAVELAYQSRSEQLGKGLGVNLRAANYSQVDQLHIDRIRPVLQDFARSNSAPLVPISISWVSGEEDIVTIQRLIAGYQDVTGSEDEFSRQQKVFEQIHLCRVVVTGSYHAAVFALAMGIPAVALAKSEYYMDKFFGLAEQFGTGCQVVLLDDLQMPGKLQDSIERIWKSAEQIRPGLLEAAVCQVELSHAAYQRICR